MPTEKGNIRVPVSSKFPNNFPGDATQKGLNGAAAEAEAAEAPGHHGSGDRGPCTDLVHWASNIYIFIFLPFGLVHPVHCEMCSPMTAVSSTRSCTFIFSLIKD